jgi:ABC-2 type transport system permease protein
MPIYDQGYRRYVARSPLHRARFWPITREALSLILAKRAFVFLLLASLAPFAFRVVQIYIVTRYPEIGRLLPVDGRLFGEFLNGQILLMVLISVFGASGLIANDLRTGAILVYLSRPLTRRDYVLGKLGVPMAICLAVTLLPGVLLYVAAIGLAPDGYLRWDLAWLLPAIVAHALCASLVVSLLTLAVSALSRSARVAGIATAGLLLGLETMRGVLQFAFGRREAVLLSLWADLKALGVALFGVVEYQIEVFWAWPLAVLVAVSAACLLILRARVRAVEIVT